MEFPQDFTARERALLGDRFDELYAYATPQPARGVTVNALRCTPDWFAKHMDFVAEPSKFCPAAFTTAPDFRPGRHPWHHAGVLYAQEPSASAPAALLDVQPGMRVADLCAAPGGKTSQLAAALQGRGLLLANEFVAARAEILRQNLERMGVANAIITNEDTARLAAAMPGRFDRVLVDAPCSGEGMFRKLEEARTEWSEAGVALCAERQRGILREAWRTLRPGGLLLYSTCTFNFTENEGVLRDFSVWAAGETEPAERIAVDPAWGVVCGAEGDFQTFRFYPHKVEGEGFFAAAVRKRAAGGERRRVPRPQRDPLAWADRRAVQELERWVEEPEAMRFAAVGDTFYGYWQPQTEAVAMLSGVLNVIASGVEMGQLFKGVLRPAHALALFTGLRRGAAAVCELPPEEALRYLRRGEVAADRFAEGMNLVTADGAALGFAKRIGRRCNNLYPNSLRILKG